MAVAKQKDPAWESFAQMVSSKDSTKFWIVERNKVTGDFRCHCPAFIFSGKGGRKRTCKHCDKARTMPVSSLDLYQPTQAYLDQAVTWIEVMLVEAGVTLGGKVPVGFDAVAAKTKMAFVLAGKLQEFVPLAGPTGPTVSADDLNVGSGMRRIIFDD